MDNLELIKAIREKQNLYNFKQSQLKDTITSKEKFVKELDSLVKEKEVKDNLLYSCNLLLKKLVHTSKASLESFLTFALNKIFTDRDYEIRLILKEDTKRPSLELTLVENGIEQPILDSVGGGILSTLGLLLQIYYIEVYGLNKTMFIDEGLKEISKIDPDEDNGKDYLSNVLDFLKWLSVERDYTFVIVSHDRDVVDQADKVYKVKAGEIINKF